jgi:hypothetical protein
VGALGRCWARAFIIPLRKQMIDIDRLRFPERHGRGGHPEEPGGGPAKAIVLLVGIVIGALIYLPAGLPQIKRPAPLKSSTRLFERGRISWPDVERTREIAGWIEAESAPPAVVAWGRRWRTSKTWREALQEAGEKPEGCRASANWAAGFSGRCAEGFDTTSLPRQRS